MKTMDPHPHLALLLKQYARDLAQSAPSSHLDARIDHLVADHPQMSVPAPLHRRRRVATYAAAAAFAALAIGAGVFIGMRLEQARADLAVAQAGAHDTLWPPADLTMWPTDSVSFKIPAEYSAKVTLVAVDPDSKHGSTRYWIDVVVSNDGTFRIEQVVLRTPRRKTEDTMASRPRFGSLLVIFGALAARAHADDAAVPECPASPAAAEQPAPNNVRLVTGSPYSAFGISQTVTTLPDGQRIVRQNTIRQWRDSHGRTRSEFSLSTIGGMRPLELNTTVTVIDDPEVRERYLLQPANKVAVTMPIVPCRVNAGLEPDLSVGPPRPAGLPMKVTAPVKLGERNVNGETAAGSRVEATIPAGTIGNEKPINMSAEQWYGKDLQVVVEATYRDPRSGETRYKLRDIHRAEPDAKLFQVPDNYTKQPAVAPASKRR